MGKIYLQLVGLILGTIVILGFLAPFLFSAESDFAVILGVVVLVAYGYALIVFVPKIFNSIKSLFNKNEKNEI
jgi:hypothetical protein